jgi:hypothetical protein
VNGPVVHDGQRRWLHELLRPPGFHLLLCGRPGAFAPEGIEALQRRSPVPLGVHHLSPEPGPGGLGDLTGRLLARLGGGAPAVYLVRPDGYLALRSPGPGIGGVASHLTGDMG